MVDLFLTLWLFNIAMKNGSFIDDFPIKSSIYKGFSMAMLNNQMVLPIPLRMNDFSDWLRVDGMNNQYGLSPEFDDFNPTGA